MGFTYLHRSEKKEERKRKENRKEEKDSHQLFPSKISIGIGEVTHKGKSHFLCASHNDINMHGYEMTRKYLTHNE